MSEFLPSPMGIPSGLHPTFLFCRYVFGYSLNSSSSVHRQDACSPNFSPFSLSNKFPFPFFCHFTEVPLFFFPFVILDGGDSLLNSIELDLLTFFFRWGVNPFPFQINEGISMFSPFSPLPFFFFLITQRPLSLWRKEGKLWCHFPLLLVLWMYALNLLLLFQRVPRPLVLVSSLSLREIILNLFVFWGSVIPFPSLPNGPHQQTVPSSWGAFVWLFSFSHANKWHNPPRPPGLQDNNYSFPFPSITVKWYTPFPHKGNQVKIFLHPPRSQVR